MVFEFFTSLSPFSIKFLFLCNVCVWFVHIALSCCCCCIIIINIFICRSFLWWRLVLGWNTQLVNKFFYHLPTCYFSRGYIVILWLWTCHNFEILIQIPIMLCRFRIIVEKNLNTFWNWSGSFLWVLHSCSKSTVY